MDFITYYFFFFFTYVLRRIKVYQKIHVHFQDTSLNNYCSNLPQDILHVCIILVVNVSTDNYYYIINI